MSKRLIKHKHTDIPKDLSEYSDMYVIEKVQGLLKNIEKYKLSIKSDSCLKIGDVTIKRTGMVYYSGHYGSSIHVIRAMPSNKCTYVINNKTICGELGEWYDHVVEIILKIKKHDVMVYTN